MRKSKKPAKKPAKIPAKKSAKNSKKSKNVVLEDEDSIGKKTDLLNAATIEVIVDTTTSETTDDDEVTVYRDIMTMTDDERNSSDDMAGISTIRLTPRPPPAWHDDPSKVKFTAGQLVMRKGGKDTTVYFLSGPVKEENCYSLVPSKSLNSIVVNGDEIKLAPKDAVFVRYWDTIPVIKAPSLKKPNPK
jgi:hypothetical protein